MRIIYAVVVVILSLILAMPVSISPSEKPADSGKIRRKQTDESYTPEPCAPERKAILDAL
jgi:hypothetical protein